MLANIIDGLDIIFEILGRLSVLIAPFNIRSNMGYVQEGKLIKKEKE